jgi:hypothetical protein
VRGAYVKIEQVVLDMKGTATFTFRLVGPSSGGKRRGAPDEIGALLSVGVPCTNQVTSAEAAAAWARLRDLAEGWAKFIDAMVAKSKR